MTQPAASEEAFLNDLLAGLDADEFFNSRLTPTPKKPKHLITPSKKTPSPKKLSIIDAENVDFGALLDGADDWDLSVTDSDFMTPQKPRKSPKKPASAIKPIAQLRLEKENARKHTPDCFARCVVESVSDVESNGRYEKHLRVSTIPPLDKRHVILADDWVHSNIKPGDVINVIGQFTNTTAIGPPSISINSRSNLLILHPDILITATALSNAPQCRRRPLLSAMLKSTTSGDGFSPSLVWGNMVHEIVQEFLAFKLEHTGELSEQDGNAWLEAEIDRVVTNGLLDLFKIGVDVELARREVHLRTATLVEWMAKYVGGSTPKATAVLNDTRNSGSQEALLAISQIHAVEEDIWSPKYGLKGKLDASVSVIIDEASKNHQITGDIKSLKTWFSSQDPHLTCHPAPLEIKTGRAVAGMEHRAQTMLYTLLASERYASSVPSGLLFYTQSAEVIRVPASRNELRGLIGARNELAHYMMLRIRQSESGLSEDGQAFLPPMIDDERTCKRCYAVDACMLYRKAVENVEDTTSPISELYDLKTSHLTRTQCEFFKKWENLIALEEHDLFRFKKELWTMGAVEREKKGRCFARMKLVGGGKATQELPKSITGIDSDDAALAGTAGGKIHRYTFSFVRQVGKDDTETTSLLNGHMGLGDAITISVEPDFLALARGFILRLTPRELLVGVDSDLDPQKISEKMNYASPSSPINDIIFRIDKDEMSSGMGRVRDNLAQLFYVDGDKRRLELVVDSRPPTFSALPEEFRPFPAHSQNLNSDQKAAMDKALSADDYALILGMPGTGKTTLIAALIASLVKSGKTILVTSYTHSAVDNILVKLKGELGANQILRLGNVDKVHPDVKGLTLDGKPKARTIAMLEDQLMTPAVVATTCLSIDHPIFSRRFFNYCIVDEASQITLPTCLGPLRHADKFILVGDHFQLPPLVRNKYARKEGLDVSLFRMLSDAHPEAVVDLTMQYRMNEDIMTLSNTLIYSNRLKCGSEEVRSQSLKLPDGGDFLKDLHGMGSCLEASSDGANVCWLERLVNSNCKVVFVDTDCLPAHDSRVGDLVQNETEAELVRQLTETLIRSGVREERIGIISLLRQQIKLLSYLLEQRKDVEILTADKSQGRDKDVIIISMVRSNDNEQIGDLVRDWRRMNVSFSRAKLKLVIFGSRKTLKGDTLLREFFDLMERRGWILRLRKGDDRVHDIPRAVMHSPPKSDLAHHTCKSCSPSPSPGKRVATAGDLANERPCKRMKRKIVSEEGVLKGRHILLDLINESK